MKKIFKLVGMSLVILIFLTACSSEWQQHYDLGMKYLSDGNYEEAIIEFEAAIEIDEGKADAYIGLAEVYIEQGDLQKAIEILEEGYEKTKADSISAKLDEIKSGAVYDMQGKQRMMTHYNAEGKLDWYHVYDYEGDKQSKATRYDAKGKAQESVEIKYDETGNEIQTYVCFTDNGELANVDYTYQDGKRVKSVTERSNGYKFEENYLYNEKGQVVEIITKDEFSEGKYQRTIKTKISYDSSGNETIQTDYDEQGNKLYSSEYEYDKNRNLLKETSFYYENGKKKLDRYATYEYSSSGEEVARYDYDANGNLTGSTQY